MPTFGYKPHNRHAGNDLKDRPLGKLNIVRVNSAEVDTALVCLAKAYENVQTKTPNGRPATYIREWQRQCELQGLKDPDKFVAVVNAAKARGVSVDADERVHWGLITRGSP